MVGGVTMRVLSEKFMHDLTSHEGMLNPILERIKNDNTLMLAIRNGYINIYYRGGNLLKLTETSTKGYRTDFNHDYNKTNVPLEKYPEFVASSEDSKKVVNGLPNYKQVMDIYFSEKSKSEREFQQLIVRENNYSRRSTASEYFITDIEYGAGSAGRFDMLAVKWPSSQRQDARNCIPALVEMKYGDSSSDGKSGIIDHLEKMNSFLSESENRELLFSTMEQQFDQLHKLGLLKFNESKSGTFLRLDRSNKPELILAIANSNPRTNVLNRIVSDENFAQLANSEYFNLKFYVSTFCGYEFHCANMFSVDEFKSVINAIGS